MKNDQLKGPDELFLRGHQITRIETAISIGVGLDLKIPQSQIGKVVQEGGSLWTSLMTIAITFCFQSSASTCNRSFIWFNKFGS